MFCVVVRIIPLMSREQIDRELLQAALVGLERRRDDPHLDPMFPRALFRPTFGRTRRYDVLLANRTVLFVLGFFDDAASDELAAALFRAHMARAASAIRLRAAGLSRLFFVVPEMVVAEL